MYDMSNIHYFIDMFYCFRPCVLHITTHDEKYYVMLSSVTENILVFNGLRYCLTLKIYLRAIVHTISY